MTLVTKEQIEDFRRKCVAYGEARVLRFYGDTVKGRYDSEEDCKRLWSQIEEAEANMTGHRKIKIEYR